MGVQYKDFNKFNSAPYSASHIGVYNSNGSKVMEIQLGNFKPNYDTRLYRFGLLSDVHNQKSTTIADDPDFQNALTIFNDKESVKFTCICGDITQNGTESELNNYKTNIENCSPNTPVYTTTGNHDCYSLDETTWESYTGCSKLMKFYNVENGNLDVFIFFGMTNYSLGSSGTPYLEEDIDWLEAKLKEYRNCRVFIFTHLFFPDKAGNFNHIYPSSNWLGGSQLERLTQLNETYLNTIWFSGHSHWMWDLQKLPDTINGTENADRANVYRTFDENNNPTCGWTVHVSSCASPIDSTGANRDNGDESDACSEGAIVDVYKDYIVVRGVSFKDKGDSDYTLRYLPIAHYKLDTNIQLIGETGELVDTPWELGGFKTTDGTEQSHSTASLNVIRWVNNMPIEKNYRYLLSIDGEIGDKNSSSSLRELSFIQFDSNGSIIGRSEGFTSSSTSGGNNQDTIYFDINCQYLDITRRLRTNQNNTEVASIRSKVYRQSSTESITPEMGNGIKIYKLYDESVEDEI